MRQLASGLILALVLSTALGTRAQAGGIDFSRPLKMIGSLFGKHVPGPDGAPPKNPARDPKRLLAEKERGASPDQAASAVGAASGARSETSPEAVPPGASASSGTAAATGPDTTGAPADPLDDILLTPEPYYYETLGRRDPFMSLVGEEYLSEHEGEDLQPDEIYVTGIVWGENDRFALVETTRGENKLLRNGDRIGPYCVTGIEPDAVVIYSSLFGIGKSVRIPLTGGKGNENARGRR